MKTTTGCALLLAAALCGGCTTYRAYPGKRQPRDEIAMLVVPFTIRAVDEQPVRTGNVNAIELLPGNHVIEWDFVYPNRFRERQRLSFRVEGGRKYRLGERFFPPPNPAGLVGAVIGFAIDTAFLPLTILFPPEEPLEPPVGEYYAWIVESGPHPVVIAGVPADLPLAHAPLSYVPLDEDEGEP